MNHEALITTLKSLKLYGMIDSMDCHAEPASQRYLRAILTLEALLKAEIAKREV